MRRAYFSRALPGVRKSSSWARGISRAAGTSDPSVLTVPLQRPADALTQPDGGRVAELAPGATDVERAALAKEVYTAPVERRADPERRRHELARGARRPDGPERHAQARRRPTHDFGRDAHEVHQRRHRRAREDVGPIPGGRHRAAEA